MSSTRNNNSLSEYKLQVKGNQYIDKFTTYKAYANPYVSYHAGNALLPSRMGRDALSYNSIDIETFLYGIGSTNLVHPKNNAFYPQLKELKSLNIVPQEHLIMPEPSAFDNTQRYVLFEN